jgi:hypothetical protein
MSSRAEWDKAFADFVEELKKEELREYINASIIAGRCSIIVLAQEALEDGLEFEDFIEMMQEIILDEYRTGVIDGETFKTFESLADDDVYGGEI